MSIVRTILASERPTRLTQNLSEQFRIARHVFLVAAPVGMLVGLAVAGYDYVVNVLLWERFTHRFSSLTLCFLPIIGMFLTGLILHVFKVKSSSMADEVVMAYHRPETGINFRSAVPKFTASVATMGFGCSAGMEGASKWVGATIASFLQWRINKVKRLHWFHGRVETTMLAGAAAGISAIFRAPLTGAIMGVESPYKHDLAHESLVHGLVAASTSYATFICFRPSRPYFPITFTYHLHTRDLLLCVPVGILGGLLSHLFLWVLGKVKTTWKRWNVHTLVKYLAGGVLVTAVALVAYRVVHEPVTLQAGLPIANRLLSGNYVLWTCIFILFAKLIASALTFGTGGVGGFFVPSATIGAAMGAACDLALHPSQPGLFTLVGIAAFTGASYNSLLFAAVFIAEATGSPALVVPGLLASCSAFLVSAGISNSPSQIERRDSDDAMLSRMWARDWMTTRIVVAHPLDKLSDFMERSLVEHSFSGLPVVEPESGRFLGIAELKALKTVPQKDWPTTDLSVVMDRYARTMCPTHSMADVEKLLAAGRYNYLPVVNPRTDQLVGILSSTDILRARHRAQQLLDKQQPQSLGEVRVVAAPHAQFSQEKPINERAN
jgi:CIC family chloride channel protein